MAPLPPTRAWARHYGSEPPTEVGLASSSRILSWVAPKANAPHWGLTAVTRHLYVPGCKLPAGNSMRNMAVSPVTAIAGGSALKTLWSDEKHCSDDRICLASQASPPCVAAPHST